MPKPVYIICASGICEDKLTNLVTIFQVLEAFEYTPFENRQEMPAGQIPLEQGSSTILAVWRMDESDSNQQFEHEFAVQAGTAELISTGLSSFSFTPPAVLQRFKMTIQGFPIMESSGYLRLISRIRKTGDVDWGASQEYPIRVTVHPLAAAEPTMAPLATSNAE